MMHKTMAAILLAAALFLPGCTAATAETTPKPVENASVSLVLGEETVTGLYTGETLNRLPHGEGVFTAESGFTFTGTFAAGSPATGDGESMPMSLRWDDIAYTGTYTGQVADALPHGEGSFTGASATDLTLTLSGGWEAGEPHGEGQVRAELYRALWQGKVRPGVYEGEVLHGLPHGEGTFTGEDEQGSFTYTGQWEDGLFHGQGTLRYRSDRMYVRQGTFTDGGFTPDYPEALNTVGSYEPLFTLNESQMEFLTQYPGLWDEEHDRRNYLKSEYIPLLNHRFYHSQLFKTPERFENNWLRLNSCRLIDRREVTFDNGMTVHTLTAVDPTYTYTFQCYLVGDVPEDLKQRSTLDMYVVYLGMSHYTNTLGQETPCALAVVGDIRIR